MFKNAQNDKTITFVSVVFLLLALFIVGRLFQLQVFQYQYYSTFALSTHEIYQKLHPERGKIYFQDTRDKTEYPAATAREYYTIYAVPKEMDQNQVAIIASNTASILNFKDDERLALEEKLKKSNDPYEPVAKKIPENIKEQISALNYKGLYFLGENYRYYPENNLSSNVLGFYGSNADGKMSGSYGLEGFFEKELAGQVGFLQAEKTRGGSLIALAQKNSLDPENGVDLLLTIDRNLEFKLCERLREGMETYGAKSATMVMMDPNTGAILAMCSLPDFDPNNYSKVKTAEAYNNTAIFTSYEPGSVFKAVTMASALDAGLVSPNTTFTDPCERKIGGFSIHNALDKCYGLQTMTGVLENSINTGVIWVEEKLGINRFFSYVDKFGFGKQTGITLNTESAGDISSLDKKGQIYGAVASFGQGITATPLQLAVAYSALANGGKLLKPYIVAEVRHANGKIDKTEPKVVEQVISPRVSKLISGMLVSVVDNGQAKYGGVKGYYIAGKTGTAQIAGPGGYTEETNHTFAGFAPADNPKFVLIVKYEKPQRKWADSTAAPTFSDMAKFTLQYYGIPTNR